MIEGFWCLTCEKLFLLVYMYFVVTPLILAFFPFFCANISLTFSFMGGFFCGLFQLCIWMCFCVSVFIFLFFPFYIFMKDFFFASRNVEQCVF
jgi:hypothetical protein